MKREDNFQEGDGEGSADEGELDEESNVNLGSKPKQKVYMPQQFNKAKRTLNKIVLQYFNHLKEEIHRGGKLFLNRSKLDGIISAITYYVGLRYGDKPERLQIKVKPEENKRRELRSGLFSYLAQSQKLINYTPDGRVNVISLEKGQIKLPELATPVPFQNNIFLLDPCIYDSKRKAFVPTAPALCVLSDNKIKQIPGPIFRRSKCAIVKDKDYIYLLGGYASQQKILTDRCERYKPQSLTSEEIAPMMFKHNCPSACFIGKQIWVFSMEHMEFYKYGEWVGIEIGWGISFLPFQYLFPVGQDQILILGGMQGNQKSDQIRLFNIRERTMINYGPILPQGVCTERSWGPCVIQGCIGVMSSIQASVYPQVGVKSSMAEVIYIHESSAYLSSIISV